MIFPSLVNINGCLTGFNWIFLWICPGYNCMNNLWFTDYMNLQICTHVVLHSVQQYRLVLFVEFLILKLGGSFENPALLGLKFCPVPMSLLSINQPMRCTNLSDLILFLLELQTLLTFPTCMSFVGTGTCSVFPCLYQ